MRPSASRPRIVRHESALGVWEMIHGEPDPRLRPHVRAYVGYTEQMHFTRRREVAKGEVALILGLGPALAVIDPRVAGGRAERHRVFVAGLHDGCVIVESGGVSCGLQVNLTPIAAHRVLGQPMHALANRTVELEDALGRVARRLIARLEDAPGWEARFRVLDAFFGARLAASRPPSEAVAFAFERLHATGGGVIGD